MGGGGHLEDEDELRLGVDDVAQADDVGMLELCVRRTSGPARRGCRVSRWFGAASSAVELPDRAPAQTPAMPSCLSRPPERAPSPLVQRPPRPPQQQTTRTRRTLHEADLADGRARRALFRVEVDLLERDNLVGRPRSALEGALAGRGWAGDGWGGRWRGSEGRGGGKGGAQWGGQGGHTFEGESSTERSDGSGAERRPRRAPSVREDRSRCEVPELVRGRPASGRDEPGPGVCGRGEVQVEEVGRRASGRDAAATLLTATGRPKDEDMRHGRSTSRESPDERAGEPGTAAGKGEGGGGGRRGAGLVSRARSQRWAQRGSAP